jgi:hypothetical protein
VDLRRPDWLLVPTSKSLDPAVPPAAPPDTIDHFKCYKIRRTVGSPPFQPIPAPIAATDQFGSFSQRVTRPVRLCLPVDKNGETPGAEDHPDHYLCYRATGAPFGDRTAFLNNQFGPRTVKLIRRMEFCVRALRNP